MSLESWQDEFYPISAYECADGGRASVGELLEHSTGVMLRELRAALRKWRKENGK